MVKPEEYQRRHRVSAVVESILRPAVDAIVLVGSMAYGSHETIRPDSDVDIICVRNFRNLEDVRKVPLLDEQVSEETVSVAKQGACNVFSISFSQEDIKFGVHFWSYKALENVIHLREKNRRYCPSDFKFTSGIVMESIRGRQYAFSPNDANLQQGMLRDLPICMTTEDDIYLFVQARNLILFPKITYDAGIQFEERLGLFWQNLAELYHVVFGGYDSRYMISNALPEKISLRLGMQKKVHLEQRLMEELEKVEKRTEFLRS